MDNLNDMYLLAETSNNETRFRTSENGEKSAQATRQKLAEKQELYAFLISLLLRQGQRSDWKSIRRLRRLRGSGKRTHHRSDGGIIVTNNAAEFCCFIKSALSADVRLEFSVTL
jgi:hypothetical protein